MVDRGWMIRSWFWVVWSWMVWSRFWVVWSRFWVVWSGVVWSWARVIRSWLWKGMVWSWLRSDIWSRFWVVGCCWFWVVWFVGCYSFIPNISSVSVFVISVIGNNLSATVWKKDSVFTRDNTVLILNFILSKISTRILVFYTIFVCKRLWWDLLWVIWGWGWMIWSWMIRSGCIWS